MSNNNILLIVLTSWSCGDNGTYLHQSFLYSQTDSVTVWLLHCVEWWVTICLLLSSIRFQVNGSRFNYSLYLVPDNLYGVYDHDTKEWNGIVRKVDKCCHWMEGPGQKLVLMHFLLSFINVLQQNWHNWGNVWT